MSAREALARRATEIADRLYPDALKRGCVGWKPKLWQAAWDGACAALGGIPEEYRINSIPETSRGERQ